MRILCFWIRTAVLGSLLVAAPVAVLAAGFHATHSQDGLDVWAVGDAGSIYRSFDGGATWTQQSIGATGTLRGVVAHGFRVVVVADGGEIWRSEDSGGTWSLTQIAGAPDLLAVAMPTPLVGFVAGEAGTLLKTTDGGVNWVTLSPPAGTYRALYFSSDLVGFVAGDDGVALRTQNGGDSFVPLDTGTSRDLLDVHASGNVVWVVGAAGTASRSVNTGQDWSVIDLDLESHIDVRSVRVEPGGAVTLAGGGGFIRQSSDGVTWSYPVHPLQAPITDLHGLGSNLWVVNAANKVVMASPDGGATWSLPDGSSVSRSWQTVLSTGGAIRGSTFSMAGEDQNAIYSLLGELLFVSRNEGESWNFISTLPTVLSSNAFVVSPKDSMAMVAAVSAAPLGAADRLIKSVDGGLNWTTTLTLEFGEYGIPIEMDPDRPDTLYFGADSSPLYRSTDFGSTWVPHSATAFLSPCDIEIVPGTGGQEIILGDGITSVGFGQIYLSQDGGTTFTSQETVDGSETPGLATSPLRPETAFASSWHIGGVLRSTDGGSSWTQVHSASSAWGMDIARDDPNCYVFGTYSGGESYLSLSGGGSPASFEPIFLSGTNYSFLARSRSTIIAQQGGALLKLRVTYSYTPVSSQALTLFAPVGGEEWSPGSIQEISWDAENLAVARIDFRPSPADPWQEVVAAAGTDGSYLWTVPSQPTTTAMIRITDAWDGTPADSSNAFTITGAPVSVNATPAAGFRLEQNHPNPFRGATDIRYELPAATRVRLDVFDASGRLVVVLLDEEQAAGTHTVPFGGGTNKVHGRRPLSPGIYFYRLRAGALTEMRKMVLLP